MASPSLKKLSPYWWYYDENFEWPSGELKPDLQLTRDTLEDIGISSKDVEKLIHSGYVMNRYAPRVLIDRYYGGALMSSDLVTRIPITHVRKWLEDDQRIDSFVGERASFARVRSTEELLDAVGEVQANMPGDL